MVSVQLAYSPTLSNILEMVISIKKRSFKSNQRMSMPFSKGQPAKIMKDFCESTSLHGYNYLYIAENIVFKIIWIFVIIGMTGIGTVFIVINTNTYLKARLVTNIESSTANLEVRVILCSSK